MERVPQIRNVLELTEDREILEVKLGEYRNRNALRVNPQDKIRTSYKIAILELLLERGVVSLDEVRNALLEKGSIDEQKLQSAWGVIGDYVRTGGRNLSGGTGLPKREVDDGDGLMVL